MQGCNVYNVFRYKLLSMPMPPVGDDLDDDMDKNGRSKLGKRKAKVIGKPAPPTKMSEDGTSDWGERCIDLYEIVDKESIQFLYQHITWLDFLYLLSYLFNILLATVVKLFNLKLKKLVTVLVVRTLQWSLDH